MKPEPSTVLEVSIAPIAPGDRDSLIAAIHRLAVEDETLDGRVDLESGCAVLGFSSEHHADVTIQRIREGLGVAADVGPPQVSYREAITATTIADCTYKRQSGGSGQFAKLRLLVEPLARGSGFHFENRILDGAVPDEFVEGVAKGIASVQDAGLLAGYPIIDFRVLLLDAACHDIDSNALAFEIAARNALREAKPRLGLVLLQPIMRVEVAAPLSYAGGVIADLEHREAQIGLVDTRGEPLVVEALAPMAQLLGYGTALEALSDRAGEHVISFDSYAPTNGPDDDKFRPAMAMRA